MLSSRADVISLCSKNASILLVFLNEQRNFILKFDEDMPTRIHSLVEKLDAGIWIQVPCKELSCSEQPLLPTFIMSKISKCNLIAEGIGLGHTSAFKHFLKCRFYNNNMYFVFSCTDLYFMDGLVAVFRITDGLSSIVKESTMYAMPGNF
jgi:hypothetical protein